MSAAATGESAEDALLRALLARVAHGERAALARLYDCTVERVYGLVRGVTRDRGSAAEVTEEVYLEVWRQPLAAASGPVIAWLWSLALARALDHLERAAARSEPLSSP
jgi:RNA polymerase sigma-70 factor (ECF subfamily)